MITKEAIAAMMKMLARPEPTISEMMMRQMIVDMEDELATAREQNRQLVETVAWLEAQINANTQRAG